MNSLDCSNQAKYEKDMVDYGHFCYWEHVGTLAAAGENLAQTGGTSEYRQGKYAGSS